MNQQDIKKLMEYRDGKLYWTVSRGRVAKGYEVGTKNTSGYWQTQINGERMYVHRIVFFLHHGFWPKQIDHIDGNKDNNAIENLREASLSQNQHNTRLPKNNTSGAKGVGWHKQRGKWYARVKLGDRQISAGLYSNKEDAVKAAQELRTKLHKEFTNHG